MEIGKVADLSMLGISYARDHAVNVLKSLTSGLKEGMNSKEEMICYLTTLHFLRMQVMTSVENLHSDKAVDALATLDSIAELNAITVIKSANNVSQDVLEKLAMSLPAKKAAKENVQDLAARVANIPTSMEDLINVRNKQNYDGGSEL